MADVKESRRYHSPVREEQAARTRARIVRAADELFQERGYPAATMKDIAARAGVARDTVHAVFGSKARLIPAIVDLRLVPDEAVPNVADSAEGRTVRDEPDPVRQIELFADFITRLNVALRPVLSVVRAAAASEPDVAETLAGLERSRRKNMQRYAEWFAARGALRVSTADARDTLFAVCSPEVGGLLCDELGWSRQRHAAWVADVLKRTLLEGGAVQEPL